MTTREDTRLTGWKEIAGYLRKDVRTVLRWERERGLPVHRPPGRRGQSVYALPAELDRWLIMRENPAPSSAPPPVPPVVAVARPSFPALRVIAAASMLFGAAMLLGARPRPVMTRVEVDGVRVRAFAADGRPAWVTRLPADRMTASVGNGVGRPLYVGDLDGDGSPEALVSVSLLDEAPDVSRAALLCFDASGAVKWTQVLDDEIAFGRERYGAPWPGADLLVYGSTRKTIAYAVHHQTWWPSMVITIDAATGTRLGRFVHAGWIMRLDVTPDGRHLVAVGIDNARDAHAVAILDAGNLSLLKHLIVPRPEASAIAAEPLDRQSYAIAHSGGPTIHFTHASSEAPRPETILELSPDFEVRRIRFSDSYWLWHDRLMQAGRLDHASKDCAQAPHPAWEDLTRLTR